MRCRNCNNLLQELPDHSLVQCSVCDAVFSEKDKNHKLDIYSGFSARSENMSDTEVNLMNYGSLRRDQRGLENDWHGPRSKIGTYKSVVENGPDRKGFDDPLRREHKELNSQIGYLIRPSRPERELGWQREEVELPRNMRNDVGDLNCLNSNYRNEGAKIYYSDSSDREGADRIKYLEKDRAELMRRLDEVNDKLSRSCDVVDESYEKVPIDRRMVHPDSWFSDSSMGSNRPPMQFRGPYVNSSPEPFSYSNRHEMSMHEIYPSKPIAYMDSFGPQMVRRSPSSLPSHYQQPSSHPYSPRQHIDTNPDLRNRRFHVSPSDVENHVGYAPRVSTSRTSIPPPINSRDPLSNTRWLNNPSEMDAFVQSRPRRVALPPSGHSFHPIAGGAPFLTCHNCFELLQLPKKKLLMVKNRQKLQCGSCLSLINFAVVDKKLVLSVPAEVDKSDEIVKDNTSHSHGHVNQPSANFSSNDYDNSGYDYQSLDQDPVGSLTNQGLKSTKPHATHSIHSSSPSISEDENNPDISVGSKEVTNSPPLPSKSIPPRPPHSSLQELFDYSSNNHAVNRVKMGTQSFRLNRDKVPPEKDVTQQNSVKAPSVQTETDVSFSEFSNTGISQDSGDRSQEDYQPQINIIRKNVKSSSRSSEIVEHGSCDVYVNGHFIPDCQVKKAEKLAGAIQPGQFWYDVQAGFWGVMGGPCLGIIPPSIEELDYPMPENCAGGDTGVFVNGRELHTKDLNLVSKRGLPTARDRYYIIDFSGNVLDEKSGQELDSLGKLARAVEKAKHGFGMKIPRAATAYRKET